MKKSLAKQKNYIGLFVFFFIIGILWGKFFYFSEHNRSALFHKPTLHLLAEKDFLLSDIIKNFSEETNTEINVITYATKEELASKLQDKTIDMVVFKSYNAEAAIKMLSPISYSKIKNREYISVDFKNLPYDHKNQFTVPLFWGITKNQNIEKTLLWIESIGITKNSKYKKAAHEFLNYTLQPKVAIEVSKQKKVASTNKSVEEATNIESKFKPSYLRKISIHDLSFTDRANF